MWTLLGEALSGPNLADVRIGALQRRRRAQSRQRRFPRYTREGLVQSLLEELAPGHGWHKERRLEWLKSPDTGRYLELDAYCPSLRTRAYPGGVACETNGLHHRE